MDWGQFKIWVIIGLVLCTLVWIGLWGYWVYQVDQEDGARLDQIEAQALLQASPKK
jgi:hypothetical protein